MDKNAWKTIDISDIVFEHWKLKDAITNAIDDGKSRLSSLGRGAWGRWGRD